MWCSQQDPCSVTNGSRSDEVGEVVQAASPRPLPRPCSARIAARSGDACQGGRCGGVSGRTKRHGNAACAGGGVPEPRPTAEAVGTPSRGLGSRGSSCMEAYSVAGGRGFGTLGGGAAEALVRPRQHTDARRQAAQLPACSIGTSGCGGLDGARGVLPDGVAQPEADQRSAARQATPALRTRGGGTYSAARTARARKLPPVPIPSMMRPRESSKAFCSSSNQRRWSCSSLQRSRRMRHSYRSSQVASTRFCFTRGRPLAHTVIPAGIQ